MMTNDDDEALVARYRAGDEEARNALIEARMGLVKHIARQHQGKGWPLDDLVQEGAIGLMVAIERFTIPGPFVAFAGQHIRGKILDALRSSRLVHYPKSLVDEIPGLSRTYQRLRDRLQREPAIDEVAQEMGLPRSRVLDILHATGQPLSLDAPLGDTTRTLGDVIPSPSPEPQADARRNPFDMLSHLDDKLGRVVWLRCSTSLSWTEIAESLGLTTTTARWRYARAIAELRKLDWSDYL